MKRGFIILTMSIISLIALAQEKEENYTSYVIVSYNESMDNEHFTVNIDDGKKLDYYRDENGKKAYFRTPAAALTYFQSLGWELCNIDTSPKDGGLAHNYITFWVFKRKVSELEYNRIVNNALIKR